MKYQISLGIICILLFSGCSSSINTEEIPENTGKIITTSVKDCEKGQEAIFEGGELVGCTGYSPSVSQNTGTSTASPSPIKETVSYQAIKNTINLSDETSEKIAREMIAKISTGAYYSEDTKYTLTQGQWTATYNPPKYPDQFDSIVVTIDGKTKTYPGLYGAKERDAYMKRVKNPKCKLEADAPTPDNPRVKIGSTYYYPPQYMSASGDEDCGYNIRSFGGFHSFSPTGYYLIYTVSGYEYGEVGILDLKTGTYQILGGGGYGGDISSTLYYWSSDKKKFMYYEWGAIYITRRGSFPQTDFIITADATKFVKFSDEYIYVLEEYSDYYLRIFDVKTREEVYSRVVERLK